MRYEINYRRSRVKEGVIAGVSMSAFGSIDVENIENQKVYSEVDIGFSADRIVKALKFKKLIGDKATLEFLVQCKRFLVEIAKKIMYKTPVMYNFVYLLTFLDPRQQALSPYQCTKKLKKV